MKIIVFLIFTFIQIKLLAQSNNESDFSKNDSSAIAAVKENYTLLFDEEFVSPFLDSTKWLPYYLPHWSSRELSKPNYEVKDGKLILKITKNQKPWCPEFNGNVKCSSIQTGNYAGAPGSSIGQHKFFNLNAVVREQQLNEKKFVPQYGYFEMKAKFAASKTNVVALWMIGYEDKPERSSELCIMEVKGWNIKDDSVKIGMGIHKFNDKNINEDFTEHAYQIDVRKFHVYAAEWKPDTINFYIDNVLVKTINQSPNYPMQFMLGIYEIPELGVEEHSVNYPKKFVIDYFKAYKLKGW